MGAAKVKILKESAVEAVWNEQSRQWDLGINDVDRIREVYPVISKGAQQIAQDRGFSDELIAKRIRQIESKAIATIRHPGFRKEFNDKKDVGELQ